MRARGDEWTVLSAASHEDCEALRLHGSGVANLGVTRTLLRPFDRIDAVGAGSRVRAVSRRAWISRVAGEVLASHPFGGLRAAAGAAFDLLPYQLEPALATLRHGHLRLLIADEVGLGKTVQAGIVLNELRASVDGLRALIVTPAGVREQWRRELSARFALESTLADTDWLLASGRSLPRDINPWSLPGVFVTSLDLVKRPEVRRALDDVTWDVVVVDEAHGAGPGTARLAAARALASSGRRVILLTATPPDGDPEHLTALCGLGHSPGESPVVMFRRSRGAAGVALRRRSVLLPVRLSRDERAMHRALERYTALVWRDARRREDPRAALAAVILRKRALSSAASLARTARRRMDLLTPAGARPPHQLTLGLRDEDPLDDGGPDDAIGAPGLGDGGVERDHLEAIVDAADRAAARESKLRALRRLLRRIREPAIVFTEYRDTLARIDASLPSSLPRLTLHGGLTPRERDRVQRAFCDGGTVLLATDAASEGLNLHHRCRVVIHFELPWTLTRLEQRTGRVDRLGQQRRVHEIVLVASDTAERFVLEPLMRRVRAAEGRAVRAWSLPGESAVAAAVMDGAAVAALPAVPSVHASTVDLSAEAAAEARRLAAHRVIRGGLRGGTPGPGGRRASTWVHAGRMRRELLVVVRVSLRDEGGRAVHEELVPLRARIPVLPESRRARHARAWADALLRGGADAIAAAAAAHVRTTCETAAALVGRQASALLSREASLPAAGPHALVQTGLFDRRAERRAQARMAAAVRRAGESAHRTLNLPTGDRLQLEVRVVAVRS